MSRVAVLDYGMGNLRSVAKALEHVAPKARVTLAADARAVAAADRVVFPGQGAIKGCMQALVSDELYDAVLQAARERPFLGICLGLQALYECSEEGGNIAGLGLFPGVVRRFAATVDPQGARLKVPHMGWNRVRQVRAHPLWEGIADDTRFYFVHSYYADSAAAPETVGVTDYGPRFTSAAAYGNIFAVQFHPEKSQRAGLRLLQNFMAWDGRTDKC
ncbi:imidazole glycerol phosphate synthase subunit HisH [Acidiferrobacter thiooxydans]|jgi:glutamine amidotransferase|uniref:Imidazole glycerol phosphate synthase subunit HisH n=1 Tax=Acidiferrobacter thiooxydans TaxID=163359 RepID=A0A1C2G3J8_9GAMM|nr:imidazole glycerol phosphate synthase subunit HisH [Acidiferrobacter thiooxydans]RCN56689.1 imidazole glycerol phosphate synthase subunit HisH [Acidiferrobacter thiooxydans]UEN99357.1 imidazole glycerol phosphate synthase subunit HisH [Acidiferrobacter thiooxydans]